MQSVSPAEAENFPGEIVRVGNPVRDWTIAAFLFLVTAITATTLGAIWAIVVRTDSSTTLLPWLSLTTLRAVWGDPEVLATGFAFSLPTLFILGTHELGHLLACRYYRTDASPPYFLPLPVALGTLGAFIRIRERMRTRRQVFDIGLAGPFLGFFALLPFLLIGAAKSSYAPLQLASEPTGVSLMQPGISPILGAALEFFHGPIPQGAAVNLHPFALAAWVGLLVTSLNLLPLGQLDGGHAVYALSPTRYPALTRVFWAGLLVAGWWWPGWWIWAGLTALMRLRHPRVVDPRPELDTRRKLVAVAALLLFLGTWTLVPLTTLDVVP